MSASGSGGSAYGTRRYLCVEPFLRDFVLAQAIGAALDAGLFDLLAQAPVPAGELAQRIGADPRAFAVLSKLLRAGRVVEERAGAIALTAGFAQALEFRELIRTRIDFARIVAPDLTMRMGAFLASPDDFMHGSALFELFDYDRALGDRPEDREATRRWVRFTTELTRHEAPVLLESGVSRGRSHLLDIGGNSGEFARQACEHEPGLRATVADLPGVCAIGREHVAASPAAARIEFVARDALRHPLPRVDWVNFKSMLHDWPDEAAAILLRRAFDCLLPGGQLSIFERCEPVVREGLLGYTFAPMVLFLHTFRPVGWYLRELSAIGFVDLRAESVELDSTFCLVRATRPDGPRRDA